MSYAVAGQAEPPVEQNRRRRWLWVVAVLAVLVVVVLFLGVLALKALGDSFGDTRSEGSWANAAAWSQSEPIGDTVGVRFPDSARDFRAAQDIFQDALYQIRFDLDASDIRQVIGVQGCVPITDPDIGFIDKDYDWWKPAELTQFDGCQGPVPGGTRWIVLDLSTDVVTVYVAAVITG